MLIPESVALTALGWVASPVVYNLINKCTYHLGSDIAKDIEDLETALLPQFELVIQAIQSSGDKKDKLTKWLARLKGAYYDAENILHEVEYEHLKSKAKGEDKKLWARITGKVNTKVSLLSPHKRELLRRLKNLKEIAAEAKIIRDLLGIQVQNGIGSSTTGSTLSVTSSLLRHKVFGRDGDRNHIINFLLDDTLTKGYLVGAITGMGGAGKTTLAQYVYNDERVKKHFGVRIWLCLSHNLDILERTKEMIECVSGKECPNLRNLSVVQNKLIDSLPESEPVLLVLDDVWYDPRAGEEQWENLLAPFASNGERCKILITSRSDSFPSALQLPAIHIQLRDLADSDFLSLFQYYAFSGLESIDTQLKNLLSDIGEQIAKKLTKSPLAAKVVGNQLRKQPTIRFWQATLENVNLKDLMEVLLWSYNRLDVHVQRCFLFSSVFPKGTEHYATHLAKYWVALDFIHASDDNRDVEEIGFEYFHIMVANSIFQQVNNVYIMHDLFHDLAEKLSAGDCLRITNSEREVPSTALHAFLRVSNENLKENLSGIGKLSNLRTLLLDVPYDIEDASEIVSLISTNFKNLRVLKLQLWGYDILPRAVGEMRNLRYINIRRSSIFELPDFVSQLYHLQYLLLPTSVKTLPIKLSNLVKLRHIELYDTNHARLNDLPPVPYLGKLTSLQRLYEFHVRQEEGYEMGQLGSLSKISDYLRIMNLENVRHKGEAVEARLVEKNKLKHLILVWNKPAVNGSDLEVIEALQPPPYLEVLEIKGYSGSRYPTWLLKGSFKENITTLVLDNCNFLTTLPQNFHQFRHCFYLSLQNLGSLQMLSILPETMSKLRIIRCPCLIFACDNEPQLVENLGILDEGSWVSSILQLTEILANPIYYMKDVLDCEFRSFEQTISVDNCSEQLRSIKSVAQRNETKFLENIMRAWWHCHQQRENYILSICTQAGKLKLPPMLRILDLGYCCISSGALSDCLREMPALEKLYLKGIMTITTFPPAEVLDSLQSLRVLQIKHCWCLRSLGGLHALPHLEMLVVECCWCLEMERNSTRLPPSLQSFTIANCIIHQAMFNGDLPDLQHVEMESCRVSDSLLLGQLISLKSLKIVNCPDLCTIRGLESRPFIDSIHLVELPSLILDTVWESWQGCRELYISSSAMLNKILRFKDFVTPQILGVVLCQEEEIMFDKSDHLQSIKKLVFSKCKTKYLPATLSDFSNLEIIDIQDCTEISGFPELPDSVQQIVTRGCPVLRKRSQPNGQDWHKIQHVESRSIQ